jgi:hypothetical protein
VSLSVDGKATKGYITFDEGKLENYIHIEALRHLRLNSEECSDLIDAVTIKVDKTDIVGRIAAKLYSSLPDWKKMGFQSSFMAKISEHERLATEGRMSTELTVFDAVSSPSLHMFPVNNSKGFSNRMFSRSARLCPDQPPKMVRYKLHGTYGQFKDFITEESRYLREKVAWSELVCKYSFRAIFFCFTSNLRQISWMDKITPTHWRLASRSLLLISSMEIRSMTRATTREQHQNLQALMSKDLAQSLQALMIKNLAFKFELRPSPKNMSLTTTKVTGPYPKRRNPQKQYGPCRISPRPHSEL